MLDVFFVAFQGSLLRSGLGYLGRFFLFSCPLFCFFFSPLHAEPLSVTTQAESAILVNAETGVVLFEKDADTLRYPASTTKIATVLYALEHGGVPFDRIIPVEQEAVGVLSQAVKKRNQYRDAPYLLEPDSVGLGLKTTQQLSLKDLLHAVLIVSANDAANILAHYLGGSITQYMQDVNSYLAKIGCSSTCFTNPHGLHHPKHVTTARDLAKLTQVALRNPSFAEIVKTVRYTTGKIGTQEGRALLQTNKLLRKGPYYYSKAIGVKTGYHSQAGHTLVSAATNGKRTLIAVLLKNADRGQMFLDAATLFETAFKEPLVTKTLFKTGKQPFSLQLEGSRYPVQTLLEAPIVVQYYPAEHVKMHAEVHWSATHLPVMKGDVVGQIHLYVDDKLLQFPLRAVDTVETTLIYRLAHTLQKRSGGILLTLFLAVGIFLCFFMLKKNRISPRRR